MKGEQISPESGSPPGLPAARLPGPGRRAEEWMKAELSIKDLWAQVEDKVIL